MKITALEGQNIKELSMIEVAHAILEQNEKAMTFAEILNAVQDYLEKSDDDIKATISRFYTEVNTDGSFIPLGNGLWALRSWYAIDEIDEEVIALDEIEDDDETEKPVKKRSKVNAFGIEDVIDPEDESASGDDSDDITYDDENPDDEKDEVEAYDADLKEVELDNVDEDVEIDVEDDDDNDLDTDDD
ncbi:DNA-directed RNA polymerase subunit delta [Lactococcus nasutitermitis]|uniref:Probable DNA-directed RNA polymerase subunit delta n=1 Tax=Lactococcus nasutitermitis TaxID=1652957 RepID=A0ABV9JDI8_9LACT|nr:DNA-directed RNA polymerase subunit delta [Lactococcus nasutitermitis]